MRLYHHVTHCPATMQLFFDQHPEYWCFVPIETEAAMLEDLDFFSTETSVNLIEDRSLESSSSSSSSTIESIELRKKDKKKLHKTSAVDTAAIDTYIKHVPKPPTGYAFTQRQRDEQRRFFENMLAERISACYTLDLFDATIVAVCK